MRKIVVIGDSLTQRGYQENGWISLLSNAYIRRADVINRGFSGYNSRWLLKCLPTILEDCKNANVIMFILFIGANDAVLPREKQHVPVEEYCENVKTVCEMLLNSHHNSQIMIITPPPVDIDAWAMHRRSQGRQCDRNVEHTEKYARKLLQMAKSELGGVVGVVDLLNKIGAEDLCDGLHFNARGNEVVFQEVMKVLELISPQLSPSQLNHWFPLHDQVDPNNLDSIKP